MTHTHMVHTVVVVAVVAVIVFATVVVKWVGAMCLSYMYDACERETPSPPPPYEQSRYDDPPSYHQILSNPQS